MQSGDNKSEESSSIYSSQLNHDKSTNLGSQELQQMSDANTHDNSENELDSLKNPASGWKYTGPNETPPTSEKVVSWSASEFVDHEKQMSWFVSVGVIAVAIALVIYLFTRDLVSAAAIVVVAILFAISGARKPRILNYGLDAYGIHIGEKIYSYSDFRSFAVMEEDALHSIQLFQFKRFTTPISLYFPPDQEDEIVNFLGNYLPHETRKHDPIDRLMRKVRF